MFRSNFQRTGTYNTSGIYELNGLKWRSQKYPVFLTWCFGFTAGEDVLCIASNDHNLYGLDSKNGQELWMYKLGEKLFSSPTICNGIIYVLSIKSDGSVTDQYLRAIDIESGQPLWKFKLEFQPLSLIYGSVPSSPVISDGVVYIGGTDGFLYSIDISSGELVWKFKTTRNVPLTPPALQNDIICVASGDGYLYAMEISTGQQRWKYEIGVLKPFSPSFPIISNQSVYIISSDNIFYSLNLQSGELLWKFSDRGMCLYAPVVTEKEIYICGSNTPLSALNTETGKVLWMFQNDTQYLSSPVMAGDIIYIGGQGFLQALNINTRREVWNFSTPLPENIMLEPQFLIGKLGEKILSKLAGATFRTEKFSTPIICEDIIYVACKNGYLYALN